MSYKEKYLKYKNKYLNLKNHFGGGGDYEISENDIIETINAGDLITLKIILIFIDNTKIIKYAVLKENDFFCELATEKGLLGCLKALRNYRFKWNKSVICERAAKYGHLECLKYAHENGCPLKSWVCAIAASRGHLECLQYAHEKGCPWDYMTTMMAAELGRLECLKYAHVNGCPWRENTCSEAARNGHLECLKYAHVNKCPWDYRTCMHAAKYGHLKCLKYAYENGCPYEPKLKSTIVQKILIPKWRDVVKRLWIVNYWMSHKDHVKYAPGGSGFVEAKTSFEQA